MSRIGKLPISIPTNVSITLKNKNLKIVGQFGELERKIPDSISVEQSSNKLTVISSKADRTSNALHGLFRALIKNMVKGVSELFVITLLLQGVGYKGVVEKDKLALNLGYSHTINFIVPKTIKIQVIKNTTIKLTGCDKHELGLFASKIRAWRIPEPYKGKGIRYENEIIRRKAGKSGKK
jgi:large subunit ribosomal protein L6